MLEVVDESGHVISQESRKAIHKQGLLHREVHVWLYTPDGKLIFQHRAKDKDTYPNLLDASVGGHVEIGDDWQTTAIKELAEETGINAEPEQLRYVGQTHSTTYDHGTGLTNNALRRIFALRYDKDLGNLQIEEGKSLGFEAWFFETLFNITDEQLQRFIPMIFEDWHMEIVRKIHSLYLSDIGQK